MTMLEISSFHQNFPYSSGFSNSARFLKWYLLPLPRYSRLLLRTSIYSCYYNLKIKQKLTLQLCSKLTVSQFPQLSPPRSRRLHTTFARALRRGGFHCHCCGVITFNFAQNCLRDYCPACDKPPVICWHFPIFQIVSYFYYTKNYEFYSIHSIL